jgi:hypothetical protein
MVPLEQRVGSAHTAASLGVFSSASLVEMHSLIADGTDPSEMRGSVGGRLRAAYVARNPAARLDALRDLWKEGNNDPVQRHARLILTATASARIAPSAELAADAPELLASMLSAGYDSRAARWSDAVEAMEGDDGDRAWALVALASPRAAVDISSGRIGTFQGNDGSPNQIRTKMLVAALAGLDRIEGGPEGLAEDLNIRIGAENRWTRLLERAVQSRQPGTVALLAAVGMQTGGWAGVPPEHLYRVVSALRRVGLDYEARMIAAEALARL